MRTRAWQTILARRGDLISRLGLALQDVRSRRQVLEQLPAACRAAQATQEDLRSGQTTLCGFDAEPEDDPVPEAGATTISLTRSVVVEWLDGLHGQAEVLGLPLGDVTPADVYAAALADLPLDPLLLVTSGPGRQEAFTAFGVVAGFAAWPIRQRDGKFRDMARFTLTDWSCSADAVCWPDALRVCRRLLVNDRGVIATGYFERRQDKNGKERSSLVVTAVQDALALIPE